MMASQFITSGRHVRIVFAAETKRLVAYRLQFWCELILSSAIELLVALTVWRAVFEAAGSPTVGGYTFHSMLLYATLGVFFGQAVRGTNIGTFARDIYDGTLTKYLVYPLSIYSYKLGTFWPRSLFAVIQLTIAFVGLYLLGYWPTEVPTSITSIILALLAVLVASSVYFLFLFCIEAFAFWADNVWALSAMLQVIMALLSGRLIPVDLFPHFIQSLLLYLPFPYLVYFPAKLFMNELSAFEICRGFIVLTGWSFLAAIFSKTIYRFGLHRYTGVGM